LKMLLGRRSLFKSEKKSLKLKRNSEWSKKKKLQQSCQKSKKRFGSSGRKPCELEERIILVGIIPKAEGLGSEDGVNKKGPQ